MYAKMLKQKPELLKASAGCDKHSSSCLQLSQTCSHACPCCLTTPALQMFGNNSHITRSSLRCTSNKDRVDEGINTAFHRRICIVLQVYAAEPILGIQFTVEDVAKPLSALTLSNK